MRNLTVKRHKSFVGCLMAYQVYIEVDEPDSAELTIGGVPCKKLGVLKNDDTQVFCVDEKEARLFVIGDRMSREICNDFVRIPAGEEDVFLSGRPHLNPANGNAFRFDGSASEETEASRKRGIWIGVAVLCIAAVIGFLIGVIPHLLLGRETAKAFSAGNLTITLTSGFERTDALENQTAAFVSDRVGVVISEEKFAVYEGLEFYTLEAYALLSKEANPQIDSELKQENGFTYYEYTATIEGDAISYITFYRKSGDAFWAVTFFTRESDYRALRPQLFAYAKSIIFSEG